MHLVFLTWGLHHDREWEMERKLFFVSFSIFSENTKSRVHSGTSHLACFCLYLSPIPSCGSNSPPPIPFHMWQYSCCFHITCLPCLWNCFSSWPLPGYGLCLFSHSIILSPSPPPFLPSLLSSFPPLPFSHTHKIRGWGEGLAVKSIGCFSIESGLITIIQVAAHDLL